MHLWTIQAQNLHHVEIYFLIFASSSYICFSNIYSMRIYNTTMFNEAFLNKTWNLLN